VILDQVECLADYGLVPLKFSMQSAYAIIKQSSDYDQSEEAVAKNVAALSQPAALLRYLCVVYKFTFVHLRTAAAKQRSVNDKARTAPTTKASKRLKFDEFRNLFLRLGMFLCVTGTTGKAVPNSVDQTLMFFTQLDVARQEKLHLSAQIALAYRAADNAQASTHLGPHTHAAKPAADTGGPALALVALADSMKSSLLQVFLAYSSGPGDEGALGNDTLSARSGSSRGAESKAVPSAHSKSSRLLSLEAFKHFCSDFKIVPQLFEASRAVEVFTGASSIQELQLTSDGGDRVATAALRLSFPEFRRAMVRAGLAVPRGLIWQSQDADSRNVTLPKWTAARDDARDSLVENPFLANAQALPAQADARNNLLALRWFFHYLELSTLSESALMHKLHAVRESKQRNVVEGGHLFADINAKLQAETAIMTRISRTSALVRFSADFQLRLD
jgi:hypothetical protein